MSDDRRGARAARRGPRLARRLAAFAALCLLAAGAYFTGGFLRFTQEVASLTVPTTIDEADGIVVLTGGAQRIERAVELLRRGSGQRLLISGVNPGTGPVSLSRVAGVEPELFECCVDLDYGALDTVGNAQNAARWAHENGLARIVLVTSDYHIPRSLLEMSGVPDAPSVVPYPVSPEKLWRPDGAPTRLGLRLLLTEYVKVLAAKARIAFDLDYEAAGLSRVAGHAGND